MNSSFSSPVLAVAAASVLAVAVGPAHPALAAAQESHRGGLSLSFGPDVQPGFVPCSGDPETYFRCADKLCIEAAKKCDETADCPGGEDEDGCTPFPCKGSNMFVCNNGTTCISQFWKCDREKDCEDGSDEMDCPEEEEGGAKAKPASACGGQEFQCKSPPLCVPRSWICDGTEDCMDASDESPAACDEKKSGAAKAAAAGQAAAGGESSGEGDGFDKLKLPDDQPCEDDTFACKSDGHCFPLRFRCDGRNDCQDGSDEDDCSVSQEECNNDLGKFMCADRRKCLDIGRVCDGPRDCDDGSDESDVLCGGSACEKKACKFGCIPGGEDGEGTCFCPSGYQLNSDGRSCDDVDECNGGGHSGGGSVCDFICINTEGGYDCHCKRYYELDKADNRTCRAADDRYRALIFSTTSQIRAMETRGYFTVERSVRLGSTEHFGKAIGLAYDYVLRQVYWTSQGTMGEKKGGGEAGIRSAPYILSDTRIPGSKKTFLLQDDLITNPEGLDFDHVGRNLYFVNMDPQGNSFVGVVPIANPGRWRRLLSGPAVGKPRGIAVYPEYGLVFYTDWGDGTSGVYRMGTDGRDHRRLASGDKVMWPNGVAVDKGADRVYWTEAAHDRIESADLKGGDRRLVLEGVSHPAFIQVFEDTVYFSDWSSREILSCNKFTGRNLTVIYKEPIQFPTGLVLYHPTKYANPILNLCSARSCSDMCLKVGGSFRTVCACGEGRRLGPDRETCVDDGEGKGLKERTLQEGGGEDEDGEGEADTTAPLSSTTATTTTTRTRSTTAADTTTRPPSATSTTTASTATSTTTTTATSTSSSTETPATVSAASSGAGDHNGSTGVTSASTTPGENGEGMEYGGHSNTPPSSSRSATKGGVNAAVASGLGVAAGVALLAICLALYCRRRRRRAKVERSDSEAMIITYDGDEESVEM